MRDQEQANTLADALASANSKIALKLGQDWQSVVAYWERSHLCPTRWGGAGLIATFNWVLAGGPVGPPAVRLRSGGDCGGGGDRCQGDTRLGHVDLELSCIEAVQVDGTDHKAAALLDFGDVSCGLAGTLGASGGGGGKASGGREVGVLEGRAMELFGSHAVFFDGGAVAGFPAEGVFVSDASGVQFLDFGQEFGAGEFRHGTGLVANACESYTKSGLNSRLVFCYW